MFKLENGTSVWVKIKNFKGQTIICKRTFLHYQDDGSLIIQAYDTEYVNRHEREDYGKTWALTREGLL